jgi:hypothetical protein
MIAFSFLVYRADFCSTIVETEHMEDGQWKFSFGATLAFLSASVWLYYFFSELSTFPFTYYSFDFDVILIQKFFYLKVYNYPRLETSSNEHQYRMLERMIAEGQGKILGAASEWDYEKGDWKRK